MDNGIPYRTLNAWCREHYGEKLYKIALDAGFTCPNLDGTRGTGGCSYCRSGGTEFAESAALGIELDEAAIPVRRDVSAACALLGLDPLYCANEGKMLAVVAAKDAERALAAMRSVPEGKNAAIIGRVISERPGKVVLRTAMGGSRILQKLAGAQLPRIC